jgi:hypothetical protein
MPPTHFLHPYSSLGSPFINLFKLPHSSLQLFAFLSINVMLALWVQGNFDNSDIMFLSFHLLYIHEIFGSFFIFLLPPFYSSHVYLIPSHPVGHHIIPFHPIHSISFHLISSHLIPFHPIYPILKITVRGHIKLTDFGLAAPWVKDSSTLNKKSLGDVRHTV